MSGKHFDSDKERLDLFDARFYMEIGEVLAYGSKKYGDDNWKGGILIRKLIGSLERHTAKFKQGEDTDHESQCEHLAHIATNAMMIAWMLANRPDMDNRLSVPESTQKKVTATEARAEMAYMGDVLDRVTEPHPDYMAGRDTSVGAKNAVVASYPGLKGRVMEDFRRDAAERAGGNHTEVSWHDSK